MRPIEQINFNDPNIEEATLVLMSEILLNLWAGVSLDDVVRVYAEADVDPEVTERVAKIIEDYGTYLEELAAEYLMSLVTMGLMREFKVPGWEKYGLG
jgi:hypothetical protein